MFDYKPDDISYKLAYAAHAGTSFTPDKRAQQEISGYVAHMEEMAATFKPFVTPENEAQIIESLELYKKQYIKLLNACLASKSAVMSTMITGPANFPTSRNEKRSRWAHNHLTNLLERSKAHRERLLRLYDPSRTDQTIRLSDPDALGKLQDKLDAKIANQELMKNINKLMKAYKMSKGVPSLDRETEDNLYKDLCALGLSETIARKMMEPDCFGHYGFSYQLSNNSAEIRRLKGRIEQVESEQTKPSTEDYAPHPSLTIAENKQITRLQLMFDHKPSEEIRKLLRACGFVFSRQNGAWQRLLNNNARATLKHRLLPKLLELLD